MLRNLNRASARGRILGTPNRGILGANIPSTQGPNGYSAIYSDLSLPADSAKEYSFRLTAWPASGSLFMYEDGSSIYIPSASGSFTATGVVVENGADLAPETITMQSGTVVTTISASVGNATASGVSAGVATNLSISANIGNAAATGIAATISKNVSISAGVGNAAASGVGASVANNVSIPASIGNASAAGISAVVAINSTISCSVGNATAAGIFAGISDNATIACSVGNVTASGISASVQQGINIAATVGNATASGFPALVQQGIAINASVGNCSALGIAAIVSSNFTVIATIGNVTAAGVAASVGQGATISSTVGTASATGISAVVVSNTILSANVGSAAALGIAAVVQTSIPAIIIASVGNASASGIAALVSFVNVPVIPANYQFHGANSHKRLYLPISTGNYSPKRAIGIEVFGVDFGDELAIGEMINSAIWSISVVDGADVNAAAMLQGTCTINGSQVAQMIGSGLPGTQYAPICTATTSLGQVLVLPEYGDGLLYVTP